MSKEVTVKVKLPKYNIRLKPCPFCGGKAELHWLGSPVIVCADKGCCRVAGSSGSVEKIYELIKRWNTRYDDSDDIRRLSCEDMLND